MASGYCTGCTCGDVKTITPPSFSSCRTRLAGGVAGILVACDTDYNEIDLTSVDLSYGTTSTAEDLFNFLNPFVNNNLPLQDKIDNGDGTFTIITDPAYHYWCVDADVPETEDEVEEETNCYAKSVIERTQKIIGDILDVNDDNYQMLLDYQCQTALRIWFVTKSGQLYGGNEGIPVGITKFNYVIPRGVKELQKISFEFEWTCLTQAPRFDVTDWSIPNIGFDNASV